MQSLKLKISTKFIFQDALQSCIEITEDMLQIVSRLFLYLFYQDYLQELRQPLMNIFRLFYL